MSSEQQTKSTVGFQPNENIAVLLDFQDKFLALVHSQLYSQKDPIDDAIVKFQIGYLTDANNAWKGMVDELTFTLVKQRAQYQNQLRVYFHKVINVDYLPLLRINRHQVTQLSLYGFDIYVDPLSAILEIINRIDGLKTIIAQGAPSKEGQNFKEKPDDIWEAIKKGWNQYMFEATLYKIAFNVYILKEYLKIGAKSLVKKDKEIVFTGCGNLFSDFVPLLKQSKQLWLLVEFSTLTNELYNFHPSFNYSHFYSLMLPLKKQYEPAFRAISVIGGKCLNTNILTPLLFAILRHREMFIKFIEQADDECWADYLNGLAYGLILNFKTRILEYEEALYLLQITITKLGALGKLDTSYFAGQLGQQWCQARDFFISALKVGYNIGQLQTWHPTDHTMIQPKILEFTANALFMQPNLPNAETLCLYIQNDNENKGGKALLQKSLNRLSENRISISQFTQTGFNPKIIDELQKQLGAQGEQEQKKVKEREQVIRQQILRLSNLIEFCELSDNTYVLSYMLSFINRIANCDRSDGIMERRVRKVGQKICGFCIQKLYNDKNEQLTQILYEYNTQSKSATFLKELIQLYLTISSTKQGISRIFSLTSNHQSQDMAKWIAANIISLYCSSQLKNPRTLKTFEKEYTIDVEITHLRSKMHSSVAYLAEKIICHSDTFAMNVLMWIPKLCPWTTIPLMSFPVSFTYSKDQENTKLQSFSLWFIKHPQYHSNLLYFIQQGLQKNQENVKAFCKEISVPNVCEQIIYEINGVLREVEETYDLQKYKYIIQLLNLLRKSVLHCEKKLQEGGRQPVDILYKKMMIIFIKCLEKLDESVTGNEEYLSLVVESLGQFYPALINKLFNEPLDGREWRTYMKKICLISLDITTNNSYGLQKETFLSSIKNDNTFLIQNSIDYFKEEDVPPICLDETIKNKINNLFTSEISDLPQKTETYTFVSHQQVKDYKLDETNDVYLTKEYLLPPISSNTLSKLIECAGQSKNLIVDLLSMTPANHHRLFIWALKNNDKDLIKFIGFSKQVAVSHLAALIEAVETPQMLQLISCLDEQSCKSISDSFSMDCLTTKSPSDHQNSQMVNLVCKFAQCLGFLFVFNQSNWRYLMEWVFVYGQKLSLNIPSVILQYLEYHRITANVSEDYEIKIDKYSKFLTLVSQLINHKYEFIQQLWQNCYNKSAIASSVGGSMLSGSSSVTPKIRNNTESITEEEIELFQINELGNIKIMCESLNLRDVLHRSANFQKELGLIHQFGKKYQPIHNILLSIVSAAQKINEIANSMAGGNIITPNFTHHFQFCSKAALYDYKINIGEVLQEYFEQLGIKQHYTYYPIKQTIMPIEEYIKNYINTLEIPPSTVGVSYQQDSKQLVQNKYNELKQSLLSQNILSEQNNTIDTSFKVINFDEEDGDCEKEQNRQQLTEEHEKKLYYLGCLLKILQCQGLGDSLTSLFQHSVNRKRIPWELIKTDWPEIYHYIKATLIDDDIASRKMTFTFKNKPLLSDGNQIPVNSGNRLKYCSLVGKACLDERAWKSASYLAMGASVAHCI